MQPRNDNSLFGTDLNEYSQNVNFQELARTVDFLYLRASGSGTGRFRIDRKFFEFARGARQFGIPVGAYHYALPNYDLRTAELQATDFANTLEAAFGENDYGDLFPVLDVETPVDRSIPTSVLLNWILRFESTFERLTRRQLMLYTGAFFIELYNNFFIPGRGFVVSHMPLWIAMYPSIPGNPPIPRDAGGWTRWRIWQFTEEGIIRGVGNPVDLNWGPDSIDLLRPPVPVSGLRATMDSKNIYVSWDKNPDIDLNGYNLFANANYITTLSKNATSYVIPLSRVKIRPDRAIEVAIEAFDVDGDFSTRRTSVTVPQNRYRSNNITTEDYNVFLNYPDKFDYPID